MKKAVVHFRAENLAPATLDAIVRSRLEARSVSIYIEDGPTGLITLPQLGLLQSCIGDSHIFDRDEMVATLLEKKLSRSDAEHLLVIALRLGWLSVHAYTAKNLASFPTRFGLSKRENKTSSFGGVQPSYLSELTRSITEKLDALPKGKREFANLADFLHLLVIRPVSSSRLFLHARAAVLTELVYTGVASIFVVDGNIRVAVRTQVLPDGAETLAPNVAQADAMRIASVMRPGHLYRLDALTFGISRSVSPDYLQRILIENGIIEQFRVGRRSYYALAADPSHVLLHDRLAPEAETLDILRDIETPVFRTLQTIHVLGQITPSDLNSLYGASFWTDNFPDSFRTIEHLYGAGLLTTDKLEVPMHFRPFELSDTGKRFEKMLSAIMPRPTKRNLQSKLVEVRSQTTLKSA